MNQVLLASLLALLLFDELPLKPNALALVWLRRPACPYSGAELAHELLVKSADRELDVSLNLANHHASQHA